MKDRNQSLERLVGWAREARALELSGKFELGAQRHKEALTAWRLTDRSVEWNDAVRSLLRWAVAYSTIIMLVSVYYNYSILDAFGAAEIEDSPQKVFQSRVSAKLYVP